MSVMVSASRYMNESVCEVPISARPVVVSSTCMLVKSLLPFVRSSSRLSEYSVFETVVADVSGKWLVESVPVVIVICVGSAESQSTISSKRRVSVPAAYSVNEMIRGRVVSAVKLVAWSARPLRSSATALPKTSVIVRVLSTSHDDARSTKVDARAFRSLRSSSPSHTNKVVESLVVVVYDELLESLRNSDASSPDVGRYLAYWRRIPVTSSAPTSTTSSNSSLSLPASMSIQYRLRFGEVVSVVNVRTASALVESIALRASGARVLLYSHHPNTSAVASDVIEMNVDSAVIVSSAISFIASRSPFEISMCSTVECARGESTLSELSVYELEAVVDSDWIVIWSTANAVALTGSSNTSRSFASFISRSNAIRFGCVPSPVHVFTRVAFEVGMGTSGCASPPVAQSLTAVESIAMYVREGHIAR